MCVCVSMIVVEKRVEREETEREREIFFFKDTGKAPEWFN